jgi:hypothetical protein
MKYLKNQYKHIGFRKSQVKGKKYDAILKNRTNDKILKYVPFGGIKMDGTPYQQFRDSTGLGLYSKYDHGDKNRKRLYRIRHSKEKKSFDKYWTSGFFSWRFLWT